MTKINKKNLPSRYVTNSHGCEARKTMLYNIKTDLYPDGLSEDDLHHMEGIVKINYNVTKLDPNTDVVSFLAETNIFPSKGEARKNVQGGGVSINRKKIEDIQLVIDSSMLLHGKYLLVQKGKKNYFLAKV